METLSGNPILKQEDDKFGFSDYYVSILLDVLKNTEDLPFTVGIYGEWGSGKTSLMKLLETGLENDYKVIFFNPWKYDCKEVLWAALLREILLKISEEPQLGRIAKKKVKALLKKVGWLALKSGLTMATAGIVPPSIIDGITMNLSDGNSRGHKYINQFEEDFSNLIKEYAGEKDRIFIFVDDLDRCLPENAIMVLESLKLYLNNNHCVFILGMDRTIVEQGIKHRYGDNISLSGREYLEKIVQLPFFLPPIRFDLLRRHLETKANVDYNNNIWDLLKYGLGGNPRKAKRFVNCYYLARESITRSSQMMHDHVDEIDNGVSVETKSAMTWIPDSDQVIIDTISKADRWFYLAKVLVLQMSYTNFYYYLLINPAGWEQYEELLKHHDLFQKTNHLNETGKVVDNIAEVKEPEIIQKDPDLRDLWMDRKLRHFMQKTSGNDFPEAPSDVVMEIILRFTGLVESTTPQKIFKKRGKRYDENFDDFSQQKMI